MSFSSQSESFHYKEILLYLLWVMGLEDYQLQWLVNHMGHTEKVHLQNYRATSRLIERLDIAKIMLIQEKNAHGKFAGVRLNDIQFDGNFIFGS